MLPHNTIAMANLVGQKIGRYHIISWLGTHQFFTTYKAYYQGAYDYVTLKILDSPLVTSTGFLERFQNLPGILEQIDHPFISQVYEVGEQDELFYLVTEFVDGVSLSAEIEARLQRRQMISLSETFYIVQSIGQAIDYLHENQLAHGHISTDNILLTMDEGCPLLVDIELAYLSDPAQYTSAKQDDIRALGLILYQLLNGQVSIASETLTVPSFSLEASKNYNRQMLDAFKAIIDKALNPDKDACFKHCADMIEALSALMSDADSRVTEFYPIAPVKMVQQVTVATDTRSQFKAKPGECPYQGLFAFKEKHAVYFFGREAFIDQLINVVEQKPIVLVTGQSGSGKSSVVYAGLVPYLRQHGYWEIVGFRPGTHPIQALVSALSPLLMRNQTTAPGIINHALLAKEMLAGYTSLDELITQILDQDGSGQQMLLVIDQFEELYTLCQDEITRARFLDILLEATTAPIFQRRLTIVLTLRVDFLGQVLSYRPFSDRLHQADVKLGPMSQPEIKRAIENPAARQSVIFDEGLVTRIMNDVGSEPGGLPLLQFALTQLWNEQENGRLTHKAYDKINGVTGALTRYADQTYRKLDAPEKEQTRRVFMQLIRPGIGTEDTRRLALRSELGDENWQLVQKLADSRLLVLGRTPEGEETVEVVHEALIREWQELRDWINEDRSFRTWQERLRTALHQWENSNEDEGALLRGILLVEAERWLALRSNDLSALERRFIHSSITLRKKRETMELEARQAKERNRRNLILVLASALMVTLLVTLFAIHQWIQATDQQQIALSNQLAAQAINKVESSEYDLAQLLSLEAYHIFDSVESRGSMLVSLQRSPYRNILRHFEDRALVATLSAKTQLLATLESDGGIEIRDIDSGQIVSQFSDVHQGQVTSIAFSPDDQMLASCDDSGQIIVWNISKPDNPQIRYNIQSYVGMSKVAFSPDGQTLATGGMNSEIILWDMTTGKRKGEPLIGHTGDVRSLDFSPNGNWLASGSVNNAWTAKDAIVLLWDLTAPEPQRYQLIGLTDNVNDLVFSGDGRYVAASSIAGDILLWDVETKQAITAPLYHTSSEQSAEIIPPEIKIALSPDQTLLASGGIDGEIILWDLETGTRQSEPLPTRSGTINDLEFSRDGNTLVSANNDGSVILWAIQQPLGTSLPEQESRVWSLTFNQIGDEPQLISGNANGTIILWDMVLKEPEGKPLIGHSKHINSVAVNPANPLLLASASDDQTIRLWDLSTHELLTDPLKGHGDSVIDVAFSPDGKVLASASRDNTIILWDTATFQPIGEPLVGHTDDVWEIAFSADGNTLASASWDGTIILWDLSKEPATIKSVLTGHDRAVVSVAISPVEPIMASVGRDGKVILWDLTTEQSISTLWQGPQGTGWRVTFSADGQTLAYVGCGQLTVRGNCEFADIRLWDVSTGRQLGQPFVGHNDAAWAVSFSPDGKMLASGSRDGTIIVWDIDLDSWITRACDIANRNLTQAEWQLYLGGEKYRETCNF